MQLLNAKLCPPPVLQDLISRPRLLDRLDEAFKSKLTLICAPAGSGKTTLLSDWIASRHRKPRTAWISLGEEDNTPHRFWKYIASALSSIIKGTDLADSMNWQAEYPIRMLECLIEAVEREARSDFVLILDDYHLIELDAIHQALTFLLDYLPTRMHLVIASRSRPTLPTAQLRVRNQLLEFTCDDLKFTRLEASKYFNQMMDRKLNTDDVADLLDKTDGWVAGLQMAALALRNAKHDNLQQFIQSFSGLHHYVMDFFVEQVLSRQSEQRRKFLLETSILDDLTASLCEAVTEQAGAQSQLEQLERENLFIKRLDEDGHWYSYHPLFREVLLSRLKHACPNEVSILHHRAGLWFENEGLIPDAFQHMLHADSPEHAASIIEKNVISLYKHGDLGHMIAALPEEKTLSRPWSCTFFALEKYWVGPRDQTEKYIQFAETALQASSLSETERDHIEGYIAAARAFYAMQQENVPLITRMAQRAIDLTPDRDCMKGISGVLLAAAYWGQGNVLEASRVASRAREFAIQNKYHEIAASTTTYEAIMLVKQGRLHEALRILQETSDWLLSQDERNKKLVARLDIWLANILRERNQLQRAWSLLEHGMKLVICRGYSDTSAEAYINAARYHLAMGDLPALRMAIVKTEQIAIESGIDPFLLTWLDDCRLRLWARQGEWDAITEWVGQSDLDADGALNFLRDLDHINLAWAWTAELSHRPSLVDAQKLLNLLERLLGVTKQQSWVLESIKCLVLRALVFQAMLDKAAALENLNQALSLARTGGFVRVFIDEGVALQELLHQYARSKFMPVLDSEMKEYVNLLILSFDRPELGGQVGMNQLHQLLIDPLSERELQVLGLLSSGKTYEQVAEILVVAVSTVQWHIKNIYQKLGVHSGMEAVAVARNLNIIE